MKTNKEDSNHGLTKREWFAAMALEGISRWGIQHGISNDEIARKSVNLADALIAELNKEEAHV